MKNFGIKVKFEYDFNEFFENLDEFAENSNYGYSLEENGGNIVVNFELLPYLPIFFEVSEDEIKSKIETCYYGAGFHTLVLEFLKGFSTFLATNFEIVDDTNFYKDEDSVKLKAFFENWTEERVTFILENKECLRAKSIFLSNQNTYPITDEDYVLTYTGAISFNEFEKLYEEGISKVCERIFVFYENVKDAFTTENYLLYHIWNSLKDLTLVDDFDERMSLAMFMFDNLIENNVEIHLPQKYAREIYKYLGVDKFSVSNFVYRKVKYEIGYHLYDHVLKDFDFNLIIPPFYSYNSKLDSYLTNDNAIFLYEYLSPESFECKDEAVLDNEYFKIYIDETLNKGKYFLGFENLDDEYGYITIDEQQKNVCEETNCRIVDNKNNKMYEINVLGVDSREIIDHMIKLI